ncbi:MAG: DinB family protein [Frankiaceae bacterium]|jgi:hypothetical protein|nr:DinB family protein [Frankiaceae bacterium]
MADIPAAGEAPEPGPSDDPPAPPPDDKDWTWVLDRPCPECGFRAAALPPDRIAPMAIDCAEAIGAAARAPGGRRRPAPLIWSALEYACHARDVCSITADRLALMIARDDPAFPNWDQDATAIEDRYGTQDPARVAGELAGAAARVAAQYSAVRPDQWSRRGRRSNGSVFTVESLGRYFVHDLAHHAHDVGRPIVS